MCSWKTQMNCEQKRWEAACVTYEDLAKVLQKRLEEMHHKYPVRAERHMIKCGDSVYFDEDSCIYRFQEGNAWIQDVVRVGMEALVLCCTASSLDTRCDTGGHGSSSTLLYHL
ncbi:hypothetical protein GDO78_010029 [Eleutherodactylus coqui]|uniref:Uncharacterized protein n=1 Tax=Eleutherodactylus coqui TaxID=57060 RepID=A0A8J6F9R7_ELECQ|nr:hypothetical protein GDO78_010029 [Eleutherodactylus coqui]